MASTNPELARRVALALETPHRPRVERLGRPSPTREIMCRGCDRWTTVDPTPEGRPIVWTRHHTDDATPSCTPFTAPEGDPTTCST